MTGDMTCIDQGPVCHFQLTSYTAELYAIMRAVAISCGPVCIYTDSLTIVEMFQQLQCTGRVETTWSLFPWWRILQDLWRARRQLHSDPIVLVWQKSHTCDDLAECDITEELAQSFGLTRQQILCNRVADLKAKEAASRTAVVDPRFFAGIERVICRRQHALARLNWVIGSTCQVRDQYETKESKLPCSSSPDYRARFPTWDWDIALSLFDQCFPGEFPQAEDLTVPCSIGDICQIFDFLKTLRWRVQEDQSVSYVELTLLFIRGGFVFEQLQHERATFKDILQIVKRVCARVFSIEGQVRLPGRHESTLIHKCGKAIPKGAIFAARPYFSPQDLHAFAAVLQDGCGQHLSSWSFDWRVVLSN